MENRVRTTTLAEALKDAQRAGYQYAHTAGTNNNYIEDILEELDAGQPDTSEELDNDGARASDPNDYIRVGDTIFRLSDAWKDDAEVYALN